MNNPYVTPSQPQTHKVGGVEFTKAGYNPGLTLFDQIILNLSTEIRPNFVKDCDVVAAFTVSYAEAIMKKREEALDRLFPQDSNG